MGIMVGGSKLLCNYNATSRCWPSCRFTSKSGSPAMSNRAQRTGTAYDILVPVSGRWAVGAHASEPTPLLFGEDLWEY